MKAKNKNGSAKLHIHLHVHTLYYNLHTLHLHLCNNKTKPQSKVWQQQNQKMLLGRRLIFSGIDSQMK